MRIIQKQTPRWNDKIKGTGKKQEVGKIYMNNKKQENHSTYKKRGKMAMKLVQYSNERAWEKFGRKI